MDTRDGEMPRPVGGTSESGKGIAISGSVKVTSLADAEVPICESRASATAAACVVKGDLVMVGNVKSERKKNEQFGEDARTKGSAGAANGEGCERKHERMCTRLWVRGCCELGTGTRVDLRGSNQ